MGLFTSEIVPVNELFRFCFTMWVSPERGRTSNRDVKAVAKVKGTLLLGEIKHFNGNIRVVNCLQS